MRKINLLAAIALTLAPAMASAVTIDIVPTSSRTVLADGGAIGAGFASMSAGDFDFTANALGTNLGVNTPYDWEIQFDATSGFSPTADYSGYLDFDFLMVTNTKPLVASTLNISSALTGVTIQWLDTLNGFTPLSTLASLSTNASVKTLTGLTVGDIATVRVSWTGFTMNGSKPVDYTPNIDFNVTASPVPVPAALPLLASAMGATGFVARRRRKAA